MDVGCITDIGGSAAVRARGWVNYCELVVASVPVPAARVIGALSFAPGGLAGTLGDAQKQPGAFPPH